MERKTPPDLVIIANYLTEILIITTSFSIPVVKME
jgi:hypothetical protein